MVHKDHGSDVFGFSWEDVKSTLWTLFVAALAAAATAGIDQVLTNVLPKLQERGVIDIALMAVLTTIFHAIRKFITDTRVLKLILIGFIISAAQLSYAEEVAVMIDSSKPGHYMVTVGADGSVAVVPTRLIRPGPAPTPGPSPTPLNQRATALRDVALKITGDSKRNETALQLAILYSEVASMIRTNDPARKLAGQDRISFVVSTGTDLLLNQRNVRDSWTPFREAVGTIWIKMAQEGAADEAYAKLLDDCVAGLNASVPQEAAQAMDFRQMLELIKMIIDMILKLPFLKGGESRDFWDITP